MATVIQNLIQESIGDGARSAKFEVMIGLPNMSTSPDNQAVTAVVKTSSFPGKNHKQVDLKYKGRNIPVKGQTGYSQVWDCTMYLSENHTLKKSFENWIEALDQRHNFIDNNENKDVTDLKEYFGSEYLSYTESMVITQYNFDLDEERIAYTLHNAFPITVSQVEANSESAGTISEFTVTFAYSHFTTKMFEKKSTMVDDLMNKVKGMVADEIDSAKEKLTKVGNKAIKQVKETYNSVSEEVDKSVKNVGQYFADDESSESFEEPEVDDSGRGE